MVVAWPLLIMLVFPWAANQEIKDIHISIIDNDHSMWSTRLVHKINSSGYFRLVATPAGNEEALHTIESGLADIILEIRPDFEKELVTAGKADVMISANAVNGTKAGLGSSYLTTILNDFAGELRGELNQTKGLPQVPVINLSPQFRYNPYLDYKIFMVPALMVMLITLLCGFLPALNIVGEKESGTIEQMNVTPVSKLNFILAKLIPYWVMGFIILTICFILAALAYHLYPVGSVFSIYGATSIYILMISGFGLVISNYSDTLQQAMFVMFFFLLLLILLSGLFTPINSMPEWAQWITVFNPLRYFMEIMRMVYLKGSTLADLSTHLLILTGFAVLFNGWAVISYRKNS